MIGTSQLINAFGAPVCFTDTTDIFKDGSGVALYGLDYDASDTGGASGKFGEAAIFNGSSSRINLASNPINGLTSVSFSFWLKPADITNYQYLLSFVNQVGGWNGLGIRVSNTGKIQLIRANSGTVTSSENSTSTLQLNVWQHIAVTVSQSSAVIYINGNEDGTFSNTPFTTNNTGSFDIGMNEYSSGVTQAYTNGSIDQVRIFNTVLTQSQVTQLYQENSSTVGTHLFGCIANYNLDGSAKESMGTTAYDGTETDITYRYDGTPTAVDFGVGGKSNYGARFNGSTSIVDLSTYSAISQQNNFSLSFWLKPNGFAAYSAIVKFYSSYRNYVELGLNGILGFNATGSQVNTPSGSITDGDWQHVAITKSSTDGTVIYVNGVAVVTSSSDTGNASDFSSNSYTNYLGGWDGSQYGFSGDLDQVRVFSKALSSAEVGKLYGGGAGEIACKYTATTTNAAYPIANTAYYKLDNNSKDSARSTGKFNEGAIFNGSNSKIDLGNNTSNNTSTISVSLWFKTAGHSGTAALINNGGSNSGETGYYLGLNSNGTIKFDAGSGTVNGSVNYADSQWHQIVLTLNSGAYNIYVDGNTTPVITGSGAFTSTATRPTWIGQFSYAPTALEFFNGSIDQVRIYNVALSSSDVAALNLETAATASTTAFPSGKTAIATYQLDGNSTDLSGSYNGTDANVTYAYDGTESNIEYRFGRYGQALKYSASTSSTITTPLSSSDLGSNFSVSFWSKLDSPNSFQVFNGLYSKSPISNQGWVFYTQSISGSYYFGWLWYYNTSQNYNTVYNNSIPIMDDTWYHVALSFTGGSQPTLYVNGVSSNTYSGSSLTSVPIYNAGSVFQIGNTPNTNVGAGFTDQIRIFDSALSASNVTQLYNEKPEVDTSNFKTVLYEGDSSTSGNYISNVGFQPDLTWIKFRNISVRHLLTDSITGPSVYQGAGITNHSNETFTSNTYGEFTSFDANGFNVRYWSGSQYFNTSGNDYVAWNWKAGGDAVQNTQGDITSDVSANTAAGFSIVKYTGNGGSAAKTIGHGLSSAPEIIISKNLDNSSYDWAVYTSATGETKKLALNQSNAQATSGVWNDTSPTNSVFSVRYDQTNATGDGFIAYCWHSVAGYSKIGTYEGDGANDYSKEITGLGFDPSFVMVKNVDSSGSNWEIIDSRRGDEKNLYANEAYSENANSATSYGSGKFITDGFKVATGSVSSSVHWNKSGDTYLYMAFK